MRIILQEEKCECGRVKKTKFLEFDSFKKEWQTMTDSIVNRIWCGRKKCWICKKLPQVGEVWGFSYSVKAKNRIYCPGCSNLIAEKINEQTK